MEKINEIKISILSKSINESLARTIVGAFCVEINPTLEEIEDIRTAVSEVITNCVVHAYPNTVGKIEIECYLYKDFVEIVIQDHGKGIIDIEQAMQPLYTTKQDEERSGMGFTIIQSFMSSLNVESSNLGTKITMTKKFNEAK